METTMHGSRIIHEHSVRLIQSINTGLDTAGA